MTIVNEPDLRTVTNNQKLMKGNGGGIVHRVMSTVDQRAGAQSLHDSLQAIYWTANLVQGDLTGYHHIVWPDIGGRLFEPAMLDGKPHWAHRAGTDPRVFAVGRLSAALRADS
ncbi:hypothetical protein M1C59_05900 [Gordonia terrae]|nr:hypothetical protein [Gordonia terrae]UPW10378.1 hypothetical protein M1C59_05900 [Gordonia terrae]